MQIQDVSTEMAQHGLLAPDLELLRPTEAQYSCLLLQPSGPIFANGQRIGNLDARMATAKGANFLDLAHSRGVHLAVTPEYFLPWDALKAAINEGHIPASDALWILGCESTSHAALDVFRREVAEKCLVLHEPAAMPAGGRTLLDPAVLLFHAKRSDASTQLVALVQFKTFPSRDESFQEEQVLLRGTRVYRFRSPSGPMSVAAILCSDALSLTDALIPELTDRATLVHVQLNPDPRHVAYRKYRATTFGSDPRTTACHIVALNWARLIVQHGDELPAASWNNIAGSTWYCPVNQCTSGDTNVAANHNRGLYYTYMTERRHALIFHYDEAVFEVLVPKLLTFGSAVMVNRNGPTATHRYEWDRIAEVWEEPSQHADSGFEGSLQGYASLKPALQSVMTDSGALGVERVLALTAGAVSGGDDWLLAHHIDSCQVGSDEVVRRMTVPQDTSPTALDFRHARMVCLDNLLQALAGTLQWPPQVSGLGSSTHLEWTHANPNHNLIAPSGPTLVAYLGESPRSRHIESVSDKLFNLLRRGGGAHQKRLCILYRDHGELRVAPIPALTRIDDALEDKTDLVAIVPLEDEGGTDD